MEQRPKTYYDVKLENSSKIFESHEVEGATPEQIIEAEKAYNILLEKLEKREEIDEGLLTGLLGGAVGAMVGPTVMKAVCNALGINPSGSLGSLLTSRLVLAAIGAKIGY
jgi:uncharacterized membrane protein YeaQ/YmgE (transglycosylase-associated protein family)